MTVNTLGVLPRSWSARGAKAELMVCDTERDEPLDRESDGFEVASQLSGPSEKGMDINSGQTVV